MTGLWARTFPDLLADLAGDGLFEVGSHGLSHAAFASPCYGLPTLGSDSEKRFEVVAADAAIAAATGRTTRYFRFPGGCHTTMDVSLVAALGKVVVQWDVNSGDAFQPNPDVVVDSVLNQVQPGSIVVLHLNGTPTAPATSAALSRIVSGLRQRDFGLVTVGTLLERF